LEERRTLATAGTLDVLGGYSVHLSHVLPVPRLGLDPEALGTARHAAGRRLGEVRVLVVAVVLADEDHRQLPQLGQVHFLVEQPLPERAFAEEADGHTTRLQVLRRVGRPGGYAGAAADDGGGAQVAGARVRDVHRPALALAV